MGEHIAVRSVSRQHGKADGGTLARPHSATRPRAHRRFDRQVQYFASPEFPRRASLHLVAPATTITACVVSACYQDFSLAPEPSLETLLSMTQDARSAIKSRLRPFCIMSARVLNDARERFAGERLYNQQMPEPLREEQMVRLSWIFSDYLRSQLA